MTPRWIRNRDGTWRRSSGPNLVKATCGCGRIIRAARATLDQAAITCAACGEDFT